MPTIGSCYKFNIEENQPKPVSEMFNFKDVVRYYQKVVGSEKVELKNGAGIVGHSLAWGKDGSIVIGSPNFNLGDPTKSCKGSVAGSKKDCRYSGIGNILKFGKVLESGKRNSVFLNPSKESEKNTFRKNLKAELNDKNQGTPSLYLGSTVIAGNTPN